MATEVEGPFGVPWAYAAMLAAGLLMISVGVFVILGGQRVRTKPTGLLLAALVGAAVWTLLRVGAPVTVPIAEDPQGAECLVDSSGENPSRGVDWDTDCGRAFTRHLVSTTGPTVVGLLMCVAAGWRIRRRDHQYTRVDDLEPRS